MQSENIDDSELYEDAPMDITSSGSLPSHMSSSSSNSSPSVGSTNNHTTSSSEDRKTREELPNSVGEGAVRRRPPVADKKSKHRRSYAGESDARSASNSPAHRRRQ